MARLRLTGNTLLLSLLAAGLLAGGFVWGFLAHKDGIFPFTMLRSLARQSGLDALPPTSVTAQPADFDSLKALPYVGGTFDPESSLRGVLAHDPQKAWQGLNFYVSEQAAAAVLLDMDGKPVHTWRFALPDFKYGTLLPGGDVLAVSWSHRLIRIDKDSEALWSYAANAHHDVWVDDRERIYLLTEEARRIPEIHPSIDALDDVIVVLSPGGQEIERISLCDALIGSPYAFLLPSVGHHDFGTNSQGGDLVGLDVLHANHVEVLDGRFAELSPMFAKDNLLVSMRHIHAIAIVDRETLEVVWLWGPGNLSYQHHPVLLDSGKIMIFNNGTEHASQILELDPLRRSIDLIYQDPGEFFTRTRGSNQRLPNGNTLITESNTGYVMEVTPDGEMVWEYANPQVDEEGVREDIWRMTRFDPAELTFLAHGT